MKSYLLQSGYQKLTADVDFPMNQHQNAWGVNDDITFDHLFQMLTERQETPWHTTFLTLSSHEPSKCLTIVCQKQNQMLLLSPTIAWENLSKN